MLRVGFFVLKGTDQTMHTFSHNLVVSSKHSKLVRKRRL